MTHPIHTHPLGIHTHPLMGDILDARDFCDYQCYQFLEAILDDIEYIFSTGQGVNLGVDKEDFIHIKDVIKKRKELTEVFLQMASGHLCPDDFDERVQTLLDNKV